MGALPNWLFSMNKFLVSSFAIVFENLFLVLFLSIKSLIYYLIFILEWSDVDKREISNTYKHIYNISNFDATWISFSKTFSTFFSKRASNLMKSILNEKFIFLWSLILMIIVSFVSGAIICLLNMAKWSIIRIILGIWSLIRILLQMCTKMLFIFMTKGFKITFVFKKFDDSLL